MEVKIKNITVIVDDQEFSFSGKSIVPVVEYNPETDPEVQGKSLEDAQAENVPVVEPTPEVPAEPVVPEATPAVVEPVAEVPATE